MSITTKEEFISTVRALRQDGRKPDEPTRKSLQDFINTIPFYHKIDLIEGVTTPGFMTWEQSRTLIAVDKYIKPGARVLDAGCRDGLFTLAAKKNGAAEILALDIDPSKGFQEILAPVFDLDNVRYVIGNVLDPAIDLGHDLDAVIFSGLLYHLRYPFLGLRRAADCLKDGGVMILETAYLEALQDLPVLLCPVGDFSPFEPTSVTFFNRRGLSDTLGSLGFKVIEILDEFTFVLGNKTRYGELDFCEPDRERFLSKVRRLFTGRNKPKQPYKPAERMKRQRDPEDSNIGRLIWVCQKTSEPTVPWTHPTLSPELVRSYWNLTATTHAQQMWLGKRSVEPPAGEK